MTIRNAAVPSIPSQLRGTDSSMGRADHPLLSGTEQKILYVGGGISGIEAAKIAISFGEEVLVAEKAAWYGGVWSTAANAESRIQVDPISFRPIEDETPVHVPDAGDAFDSIYPDRAAVLSRLARDVTTFGIAERTLFRTEVVSFRLLPTSGLVEVQLRFRDAADTEVGIVTRQFRQLHIRTGSLQEHNGSNFTCAGIDEFTGIVARGIGNDVTVGEMEGKDIVIIGMGAFAVENTRRALMAKAKSITVVSRRRDKLLFPECATYLLRSRLAQPDALSEENVTQMWRDVSALVKKGAEASGLSEQVWNDRCVAEVAGENHFIFSNGLPSMASNTFLLGHYYGLVRVLEDQMVGLTADAVLTAKHGDLPADILLRCVGFGTEERLLDGHTVADSFFIDGCPQMTHNLRGDRVNGQQLIGPRAQVSNFLISYYEDAQEYERCILLLNRNPAAFAELAASAPAKNVGVLSSVDYFSTLILSDKLASLPDDAIAAALEQNRTKRKQMYDSFLPATAFAAHDRETWNRLSHHLAKATGKPVLEYPFA